jgi:hypothetical protein
MAAAMRVDDAVGAQVASGLAAQRLTALPAAVIHSCRASACCQPSARSVVFPALRQGRFHMAKRTTHRSSKGTKLYAVRDKEGKFKDIQTYKRAHTMDMKRKSKSEVAAAAKPKAKKAKAKSASKSK